MKIAKNGFLYFFLLILLIFIQIFFSHQHRVTTFHDKTERNWIRIIEKSYELLDGTWDSQIGSSSQAIFGYQVTQHKKHYVAIARRKEKIEDVLLSIQPETSEMTEAYQFNPYLLQKNNNLDFRGVMDIDMDDNLELVVVVNGNYGKRLFIFPLLANIKPIHFFMLEIYHRIQLLDLDQDGLTEIIAYIEKDSILQPPSIFHFKSGQLQILSNADYPIFMNQYYLSLQTKKRLYQRFSNPELKSNLLLTEIQYHIAMENINQATTQYSTMVTQLPDSGIERKLFIYRGKILLASAFLKINNMAMMDTILQEAVNEFMLEETPENHIQSQIFAEKGLAYLQNGSFKEAEECADKALEFNHDNVTAKQLKEWLPKQ